MKINSKHLEMVIYKLRYELLGYSNDDKDLDVEISLTKEDPGNGVMTDCLTITGTKPNDDKEMSISVEIYSSSENLEPRASKTQSYKITAKY